MIVNEILWKSRLDRALSSSTRCYKIWNKIERLNIGITNRCNANCIFCFREEFNIVPKRNIPYELIIEWINEIASHSTYRRNKLKRINIGLNGEPLLYPVLADLVKHASTKAKDVRISTNLAFLDENKSQALLEAGLSNICFSIDECEKERFEVIRRNIKFETILENAIRFKEIRDEGNYKCKISLSPVLCKENEHRQEKIKRFWEPRLDIEINFSKEIPVGTLIDRVQPWFNPKSIPQCNDMVVIKANGDLNTCCFDVFSNNPIGNMYTSKDFNEVLKGKELIIFRNRFRNVGYIPFHCKICIALPQLTNKRSVDTWDMV